MENIIFRRTGKVNPNGSVPGVLMIGEKVWPTIERGVTHSFARRGLFNLKMTYKSSGRRVQCLQFNHKGISKILIHDAFNDNHMKLSGCIAPGIVAHRGGISGSAEAMKQVIQALGGFIQNRLRTILIENNVRGRGNETGKAWIIRRIKEGKI